MRIVVDARWIGETPSGVGVYTHELLRRLPRLAPDINWHLLLNSSREAQKKLLKELALEGVDNVGCERLPYGIFSPEGQLRLPWRLRELRSSLYFSPNYMMPYQAFSSAGAGGRGFGRAIVTIHDVIPLLLPDHAPRSRKSRMLPLFRACLRWSVRRSAAVITVSNTSRSDIVKALHLSASEAKRITSIYNGVDERFVPPTKPSNAATRTLLYVGRIDPYKNLVTLIRAFAQLRQQSHTSLHLLIIGPDDPRYPEARRMVADLDLREDVTFLGFLRHEQLVAAYQEATMLINPSSYEGFGLPLIEAMRCGLPVVCCDGGAQREIVGDAALVVPADDTHALCDAISRLLNDATLSATLRERGLERARQFTWDNAAAATLSLFRRVISGEVPS